LNYLFALIPLPGDAAVTGVRVSFGEIEIVAELKEREQAETDYKEAAQTGLQAALATRESPDVFTLRVAGIQPDQEIRVETSYAQLARVEGAGWSLSARPLNLPLKPGETLRLALVDPAGVWSEGAPHIEVALEWA
jgi:hypothetical protein